MFKYVCKKCGNPAYTAVDPEHLHDKTCSYCGGELAPADPEEDRP